MNENEINFFYASEFRLYEAEFIIVLNSTKASSITCVILF